MAAYISFLEYLVGRVGATITILNAHAHVALISVPRRSMRITCISDSATCHRRADVCL